MPKRSGPIAEWIIIAIRNGAAWPLLDKDDSLLRFTWADAGAEVQQRTLCRASENLLVNLDTGETRWR